MPFYDMTIVMPENVDPEHARKFGGYNDFPPGWREITQEDFARSIYFTYAPRSVEYRQMLRYMDGREHSGKMVDGFLYFFHDGTGFSIINDFWANTVRFYAFGCAHEYAGNSISLEAAKARGITISQHDSVFYCPKCGHLEVHDSSD